MEKLFLITTLFMCGISLSAQNEMTDEEKYLDAMHRHITSEKLFGYVCQLSDSTLEGRLAGSPGMARAVEIVKAYYARFDLVPAGNSDGYIQEFPHP